MLSASGRFSGSSVNSASIMFSASSFYKWIVNAIRVIEGRHLFGSVFIITNLYVAGETLADAARQVLRQVDLPVQRQVVHARPSGGVDASAEVRDQTELLLLRVPLTNTL